MDDFLIRESRPEAATKESYTYGDYLSWSDEERWELINGIPYDMSPAPSRKHQEILGELHLQFATYLKGKPCKVFLAPFDVRLPQGDETEEAIRTVVQPDLTMVCDHSKLDERGCLGVPDMTIEILSPHTAAKDLKIKLDLYERFGVKEYWLVQPMDQTIMVFTLREDGKYAKPTVYDRHDTVKVGIFQGALQVDANEIFGEEGVLAALAGESGVVKEEGSDYAKQGEYTYEDYLKLPEEPGYRFEILEGWLVKEPSPSVQHQRVSAILYRQLAIYYDQFDPEGEIFSAPLDVTLTNKNVVQPDLLFISGARKGIMCRERIDGPCDLVVEIMSPRNRRKDRLQKMEIYRKAGIPHYWLVDPEDELLEAFMLKDGNYSLVFNGGPGDQFKHPAFIGLELDLDKVFYRPPEGSY